MYYTANFTLVTRRNLISSVINTISCSAVNVADVAILYLQTWTVYFPKAVRLALNVCPCRPDNASSSPPTRASPCQILVKPSVRVSFLLQRPGRALQCVSYTLLDFPSLPMLAICSVPFADAALSSFLPSLRSLQSFICYESLSPTPVGLHSLLCPDWASGSQASNGEMYPHDILSRTSPVSLQGPWLAYQGYKHDSEQNYLRRRKSVSRDSQPSIERSYTRGKATRRMLGDKMRLLLYQANRIMASEDGEQPWSIRWIHYGLWG